MDTPRITVLIADDYYAFRQALKIMLSFEPDVDVVAEAVNGRQTLELAREHKPTAIVMDLSMGALSGIELIRQLLSEHPRLHILVVSGQADQRVIDEILECGAKGYISKSRSLVDVPVALRKICKGRTFVRLAQANRTADRSV
jgi:DNA-binding NarL/FixJ family response regulator